MLGFEIDLEGYYEVFNINIMEVFRGLLCGFVLNVIKLYIFGNMLIERVIGFYGIRVGVEYFLYGEILKGVGMYMRFFLLWKEWNNVIL